MRGPGRSRGSDLFLAGLSGDAQNLASIIRIDGHRHYGGGADDWGAAAHLDLGGVGSEAGPFPVQRAAQECVDPLVDLAAKP